jgi:hypothetical protein
MFSVEGTTKTTAPPSAPEASPVEADGRPCSTAGALSARRITPLQDQRFPHSGPSIPRGRVPVVSGTVHPSRGDAQSDAEVASASSDPAPSDAEVAPSHADPAPSDAEVAPASADLAQSNAEVAPSHAGPAPSDRAGGPGVP